MGDHLRDMDSEQDYPDVGSEDSGSRYPGRLRYSVGDTIGYHEKVSNWEAGSEQTYIQYNFERIEEEPELEGARAAASSGGGSIDSADALKRGKIDINELNKKLMKIFFTARKVGPDDKQLTRKQSTVEKEIYLACVESKEEIMDRKVVNASNINTKDDIKTSNVNFIDDTVQTCFLQEMTKKESGAGTSQTFKEESSSGYCVEEKEESSKSSEDEMSVSKELEKVGFVAESFIAKNISNKSSEDEALEEIPNIISHHYGTQFNFYKNGKSESKDRSNSRTSEASLSVGEKVGYPQMQQSTADSHPLKLLPLFEPPTARDTAEGVDSENDPTREQMKPINIEESIDKLKELGHRFSAIEKDTKEVKKDANNLIETSEDVLTKVRDTALTINELTSSLENSSKRIEKNIKQIREKQADIHTNLRNTKKFCTLNASQSKK